MDRIDINKNVQVEAAEVIAILTDRIADLTAQNAVLTVQVNGLIKVINQIQEKNSLKEV
ncbi:MAG: hypothetical protein RI886_1312 [Pseudomonadota bacterium]